MAKKHWIYIKRGLSEDPKHRAQMGECIWLYMHIIDRADWETGIAYDWKDKDEATEMSIPVDTLRYQRQKLEEMDYIRCKKKQYSQDICIMEWKNPRDYGAETKNPRFESSNELPLSNSQSDNQSLNQSLNQLPSPIKTPTYTSKSKVRDHTTEPDFENMTVPQAHKVPTLKMFNEATGWLPADILWKQVHEFITAHNLTKEQIKHAAVAWIGRGYNRRNVMGILEWAANGAPSNGQKPTVAAKPAIDENAVQSTMKMLEEKWGNVKPANGPRERPRIGGKSL